MKKKYPDQVVFNYETESYDANKRDYPTSVGSQKFEPISIDLAAAAKANHHFKSKFDELKAAYNQLANEYQWNKLIYNANYSFQPIVGQTYHLYKREDNSHWLSLIGPEEWKKKHIGSFKLQTNGTWRKISSDYE